MTTEPEICPRCETPQSNVGPWKGTTPESSQWTRLCGSCKVCVSLAVPGVKAQLERDIKAVVTAALDASPRGNAGPSGFLSSPIGRPEPIDPLSPEALKRLRLTATMRAHVLYGIAGATRRTQIGLDQRGLLEDAPERPGCVKLSRKGLRAKKALELEEEAS
jgi:hypothetical protein